MLLESGVLEGMLSDSSPVSYMINNGHCGIR